MKTITYTEPSSELLEIIQEKNILSGGESTEPIGEEPLE